MIQLTGYIAANTTTGVVKRFFVSTKTRLNVILHINEAVCCSFKLMVFYSASSCWYMLRSRLNTCWFAGPRC